MAIQPWDKELSSDDTNFVVEDIARFCTDQIANKELRKSISVPCGDHDYRALLDMDLDYTRLSCSDSLWARQVLALFSKREDLELGIDREAVAHAKFAKTEQQCEETNALFKTWSYGDCNFTVTLSAYYFAHSVK